jgi:hypothetical protein
MAGPKRSWLVFAGVVLPCICLIAYSYLSAPRLFKVSVNVEAAGCFDNYGLERKGFMLPIRTQLYERRKLQNQPLVALKLDGSMVFRLSITTIPDRAAEAQIASSQMLEAIRGRMMELAGKDVFTTCAHIGSENTVQLARDPDLWKRSLVALCLAICLGLVAVHLHRLAGSA